MTSILFAETAYLSWLAAAKLPADELRSLLNRYHTGESVYAAFAVHPDDVAEFISSSSAARLIRTMDPANIARLRELVIRLQIRSVTFFDPNFPSILSDISDPVSILFYQGDIACLQGRIIGMVGSRRASRTGLKAAESIARDLSSNGIRIVSGFAYGIDSACHQGCLSGRSPTIAVMGCGLDQNYPADNSSLRKHILDAGGLFLSEFAPEEKPLAANFPYRNRIISAIGEALVLIEARTRSGSLRTVDHALKQGKEVFVYPGEPSSPFFEGNHQLLRDGARFFTTAGDILEDMNWLDNQRIKVQNSDCSIPPGSVSPSETRILSLLASGTLGFEQLATESGLPPGELLSMLTVLQVRGMIETLPGKKYQLKS